MSRANATIHTKTMVPALALCAAALLCAACGQKREEEPIKPEDTVFGDQLQQIDRAKEAAAEAENRMQDLNSQLDQAEGAAPREPDSEETSGN